MGDVRKFGFHNSWSDHEIEIVNRHYATATYEQLEAMLPGRGRRTIMCKANAIGLQRLRPAKRTPEETREAKRIDMANRRSKDPAAQRKYQKENREKNRNRINSKVREQTSTRIFWARALRLRNGISANMLANLWKKQRGRCALSGLKLDRTAEIDHKLPKVRGGLDRIENLQWVTKVANRAKRDLTDAEFLVLCEACVKTLKANLA